MANLTVGYIGNPEDLGISPFSKLALNGPRIKKRLVVS